MKTLHQDSMLKVRSGISTIEEVLASVSPDMIVANASVRPLANYA
jgi:type IV pilus assembly protein PilB